MLEVNFWQDKDNSKKIIKEKKLFEDLINTQKSSIEKLSDLNDLSELALEEKNEAVQKEILQNIKELRTLVKKNEIKCFLSNEADSLDCYIEIHAGAGGTESQDWAEMLRRMYLKWADQKNFKSNLISEHKGDEAGIKSSTIKVEGDYVLAGFKKSLEFIDWLEYPHSTLEQEGTQVLQVYGCIQLLMRILTLKLLRKI